MKKISLNGQDYFIEHRLSLQALLTERALTDQHFAVAINNQFIPNSFYTKTWINEGDCVDIIIPMQGG